MVIIVLLKLLVKSNYTKFLPISKMENPPTKKINANPETWLVSCNEALMGREIYGLMSFDFKTDRVRYSDKMWIHPIVKEDAQIIHEDF